MRLFELGREGARQAGAWGGAVGAGATFLLLALFGKALRAPKVLAAYVAGVIVLTLLAYYGFAQERLPDDLDIGGGEWVADLYFGWQLVFAAIIVFAFREHVARRFVWAPPSSA